MPTTNPLLQKWDLPAWQSIRVEHLVPAIEQIVADNHLAISTVIDNQATYPNWDDLVLAVDETDARLDEAMGVIQILDTLTRPDTTWRQAIAVCEDISVMYKIEKMGNAALFRVYQTLAHSLPAEQFDSSRKTVLSKTLLAFRHAGVELNTPQRQELAELNRNIEALERSFLDQLTQASASWSKRIDDIAQLSGMSQDVLDRLALNAQQAGHDGWRLPLDEATYTQVMTYAEDRALREEYYFAYATRASDQGPQADQFDNAPLLQKLLSMRHRKARLLGFENYAQLRLVDRMVDSTQQVKQFLRQQIALATPAFAQETQAIKDFAFTLGISKVQPWDHEFLVAKLRETLQGPTLKGLRKFFPLDATLRKLCVFCERMFGIRITEQSAFERWDDSVQLFEIEEQGRVIGHIYFDPYKRKEALDFAGTSTLRNRRRNAEGRVRLPIAVLHANFPRGVAGQPYLLTHKDLRVLLHELGHCLQQVLTRSPHYTLSGLSQLGRDTAEFAGQVFELWCLSREFLSWLAAHYQTGERLSDTRIDAALTSLKAYDSVTTGHLLMSSLYDLELHLGLGDGRNVQQVFDDVLRDFPHLNLPQWSRFPNSFDYLVTGYEVSVYAYKWSGALATETFKRFESDGVFNAQTGKLFREAVFAPGGSRSLIDSLEAFLERPVAADLLPVTAKQTSVSAR